MIASSGQAPWLEGGFTLLTQGEGHSWYRGVLQKCGGHAQAAIAVVATEPSGRSPIRERMKREYELRHYLHPSWAAQPITLDQASGVLWVQDPGGELLAAHAAAEVDVTAFLAMAVAVTDSVSSMHAAGIVHKNLRPDHVFVNLARGTAHLTGFGIAEAIESVGTERPPSTFIKEDWPYMAPEQISRGSTAVDIRSDLYSLGVSLYQLLTAITPFTATDPAEWLHHHLARRPLPPAERRPDLPVMLSDIVMKLLSKDPAERYQSAAGLRADLLRCLDNWRSSGETRSFPIGTLDDAGKIRTCDTLYGRQADVDRLVQAFNRVADSGKSQLVLVSGPSGMGKSSLVNALQMRTHGAPVRFALGKLDQYQRDIPYAPLADAFRNLVKEILGRTNLELDEWRTRLKQRLGVNCALISNLIPELDHLLGPQPAPPDLSGGEAKSRFIQIFEQFVGLFASKQTPLVLFLDDLQWLDPATLDVFEALAIRLNVRYLLLIGAYRSDELDRSRGWRYSLGVIRSSQTDLVELELQGIGERQLKRLIADALGTSADAVQELSKCIYEKTGDNPFFAIQFLRALAESGLLRFNWLTGLWGWDSDRIRLREVGDNIADLMVQRLGQLTRPALTVVQALACMGNKVAKRRVAIALECSPGTLHHKFRDSILRGLVLDSEDTLSFAHDRIHEAAYATLSEVERSNSHKRIGTLLLSNTERQNLDTYVFEIASHLNRVQFVDSPPEELLSWAELSLVAGRKARRSAAFKEACSYLLAGKTFVPRDGDTGSRALSFELGLEHTECSFLAGDLREPESLTKELIPLAHTRLEMARAYRLMVEMHVVRSENTGAVESALTALNQLGISMLPHPSREEAQAFCGFVWRKLEERELASCADLPPMSDPLRLAAMRLLAETWPPAYFTDFNLAVLVICHMVDLSIEYGSTEASNQGFALMGWLAGPVLNHYDEGYRLATTAANRAATSPLSLDRSRTFDAVGLTAPWTRPISESLEWARQAHRFGIEAGDVYFASYSSFHTAVQLLLRGRDLREDAKECAGYLNFSRKIGFEDGYSLVATLERAMACLLGQTVHLTDFSDENFDGLAFEKSLVAPRMNVAIQSYWTVKTMLYLLGGNARAAVDASSRFNTDRYTEVHHIRHLDYHYYSALSISSLLDDSAETDQVSLKNRLMSHFSAIKTWAVATGSSTFTDKQRLIEAEIARLEGRDFDAAKLYNSSTEAAHENGFLHCEALANEFAARFYRQKGMVRISDLHLREALDLWQRWGAYAKVRQLVEIHPELRRHTSALSESTNLTPQFGDVDYASVLKGSRAVSGGLMLDQLVTNLMQTVVEHAGAERALLILPRGEELVIEAEAETGVDGIAVKLRQLGEVRNDMPESIVRLVTRTSQSLMLQDASIEEPFSSDPYIRKQVVRSLMCMPIASNAKLQAVLYLENNLAPRVFTLAQLEVIKLLAGHAALSLENARLYTDLQAREAKIRRIFDSNVIGIVFWDLSGELLDANEAFLRMVGYSRAELENGTMRWFEMTPPEWQDQVKLEVQELHETGALKPIEKEYFRKDGSRVPVLLSAATFEGTQQQGIALIVDISKQKQAEARALDVEVQNLELQAELAHANRLSTLGQLSSWIAHDVKQPLAAIVRNSNAGIRWLSQNPPDTAAAERAFHTMVQDGMRAAEILDHTRDMVRKREPQLAPVILDSVVEETVSLIRSEAVRNDILISIHLRTAPLTVLADRIQLQQVILNLLVNAVDALKTNGMEKRELLVMSEASGPSSLRMSVKDSGLGLPFGRGDACFEAFFTTKKDGLGMGLTICRSIVESFGGRIWVEPNIPSGAVISVLLPVFKTDEAI